MSNVNAQNNPQREAVNTDTGLVKVVKKQSVHFPLSPNYAQQNVENVYVW